MACFLAPADGTTCSSHKITTPAAVSLSGTLPSGPLFHNRHYGNLRETPQGDGLPPHRPTIATEELYPVEHGASGVCLHLAGLPVSGGSMLLN